MTAALVICLILAVGTHANSIAMSTPPSSTNVSEPSYIKSGLAKVGCFLFDDLQRICSHGCKRHDYVVAPSLMERAMYQVGLQEMRKSLGIPPSGRWDLYNGTKPSEEELKNAPSRKAYFDLKTPRSREESIGSREFFQHNFQDAYEILDSSYPSIRYIFSRRFNEIVKSFKGKIGREQIDDIFDEYSKLSTTIVKSASKKMFRVKCFDLYPSPRPRVNWRVPS